MLFSTQVEVGVELGNIPCWLESNAHSIAIFAELLAKPELGRAPAVAC